MLRCSRRSQSIQRCSKRISRGKFPKYLYERYVKNTLSPLHTHTRARARAYSASRPQNPRDNYQSAIVTTVTLCGKRKRKKSHAYFACFPIEREERYLATARMIWNRLNTLLVRLYDPIDRAENLFLRTNNISVMTNQVMFLMLADHVFITEPKMTCLYTLMFYNVVAYCIGYIEELIERKDWSLHVTLTEKSKIKHLAVSATKIVLEWTKAVTFIVTLTFVFLVFGLHQGLEHYKPSTNYITITWIYYLTTEKVFVETFPSVLKSFRSDVFENLEELYASMILKSFAVGASACLVAILAPLASWKFLLVAVYSNVYLRSKDLLQISGWPVLKLERETLNRYRRATAEEIKRFDDVCPVCLCDLISARVTPCSHLFHADCLRQCLKTNDTCPVCKRELTLGSTSSR